MEGRAIARPNILARFTETMVGQPRPSMEGRAIARPNHYVLNRYFPHAASSTLQWRAGQLPGQTGSPGVP